MPGSRSTRIILSGLLDSVLVNCLGLGVLVVVVVVAAALMSLSLCLMLFVWLVFSQLVGRVSLRAM